MLYFNTEQFTLTAEQRKTYDSSLNIYGWLQMVLIAGLVCAAIPVVISIYSYSMFGSPEQVVIIHSQVWQWLNYLRGLVR